MMQMRITTTPLCQRSSAHAVHDKRSSSSSSTLPCHCQKDTLFSLLLLIVQVEFSRFVFCVFFFLLFPLLAQEIEPPLRSSPAKRVFS